MFLWLDRIRFDMFCPSGSCIFAWQNLHSSNKLLLRSLFLFLSMWCTCKYTLLLHFSHTTRSLIIQRLTVLFTGSCSRFSNGSFQLGLLLPLKFMCCHSPLHVLEQKVRLIERWCENIFLQNLHDVKTHLDESFWFLRFGMSLPFRLFERNLYEQVFEQVRFGFRSSVDLYVRYVNEFLQMGQILVYKVFIKVLYHKERWMVQNA